MTRNDLVFWPLKYLIFEVCRGDYLVPIGIRFSFRLGNNEALGPMMESCDRAHRESVMRLIGVATRVELTKWKRRNQKATRPSPAVAYLKVKIIEHSPKNPSSSDGTEASRGSRAVCIHKKKQAGEERNKNAIEKTNQRVHNRFRSKDILERGPGRM
jgi:hypothetical protein